MEEFHKSMTICPRHRAEFGIRWRCSKVRCSVPTEIAAHKTDTVKGDRRLDSTQSAFVLRATGKLVPVGPRKLNAVSFCIKHLLGPVHSPSLIQFEPKLLVKGKRKPKLLVKYVIIIYALGSAHEIRSNGEIPG